MKIEFQSVGFSQNSRMYLHEIEQIVNEYSRMNIKMTLRQLYYQLVARDKILEFIDLDLYNENIAKEDYLKNWLTEQIQDAPEYYYTATDEWDMEGDN